MRLRSLLALLALALLAAGCGSDSGSKSTSTQGGPVRSVKPGSPPKVTVPKGPPPKTLVVKDLRKGTGVAAQGGDKITVHYTGVLYENGKKFDSSWDTGQPFPPFILEANAVIPGWDKGLIGMRVGGRRELIVPPRLAYGAQGSPPSIPPNATLVFVIDLLKVA